MAILRVALVTPLTGPLARFGRAGSTALDVWARQAARLPAGWRCVKLEVHDAHPNPAQAMSASTSGCDAVEADIAWAGLGWNHGGATSQLARPRVQSRRPSASKARQRSGQRGDERDPQDGHGPSWRFPLLELDVEDVDLAPAD